MNTWAKIGLSIVGVAAVAGVYFGDEYYTKKEDEQKLVSSKAVHFETQNVRTIVLNNDNGQFFFERDDATSDWRMTEPRQVKPDQDAVNNFLSAVQSLKVEQEVPNTETVVKMSEEAASQYGLSKPRIGIEVRLADNKIHKLFIGNDVRVGSESDGDFVAVSTYAVNPDKHSLLVVSSSIVSAAKKNFSEFRTKVAGDFKPAEVSSFTLSRDNGITIELKKEGNDWKIVKPTEMQADNNNVGLYLDRISKQRVEKVIETADVTPNDRRTYNLEPASATLSVSNAEGALLQNMQFGLTKEKVFLTMADGAYGEVDLAQWADLVPELKYFRDRRVMRDVAMGDVLRIKTLAGNKYQREGNDWFLTTDSPLYSQKPVPTSAPDGATPAAGEAAADAKAAASIEASRVFSDWEFLTADDIIDGPDAQGLASYGLNDPLTRFSFEFKDDANRPAEEILVGNRVPNDEKRVYVKRASKPAVYIVETAWLDNLQKLDEKPEGPHATNNK